MQASSIEEFLKMDEHSKPDEPSQHGRLPFESIADAAQRQQSHGLARVGCNLAAKPSHGNCHAPRISPEELSPTPSDD